jgi:hypothetical protein
MTLEYKLNHSGLGTVISVLSMLMSSGQQIKLYSRPDQVVHKLKSFLNISDDQLLIAPVDSTTAEDISSRISDQGKYFSPYFNVDNVRVFGRTLLTQKPLKTCIGLAMYARSDPGVNTDNRHPYNRYYSQEVYAKIFQLIVDSGYDVITLNSQGVDLEHKIFMLNELCDCVIGYEGGIAHLAHLLKIPSIILPYHHDGGNGIRALRDSSGRVDISLLHATHLLHIDRRTYLLNSEEELLNWQPAELRKQIINLHNQQGNNVVFGNTVIDPATLEVKVQAPGLDNMTPLLTDFEKNFIKTYVQELKIG